MKLNAYYLTIKVLILCISINISIVTSHCGVGFLQAKRELITPIEDKSNRYLAKSEYDNLRIHLDYSFIENNIEKFNQQDLIDLKEKIMPKTKSVFEKLLKVQRIQGKLRFDTNKCDSITMPELYTSEGEGVNADLVIFVMIDDTGFFSENGIEAAAVHCLQHGITRRPVAGYIQFKPNLEVDNSTALDYQVWLAIHEVSHILAMNESLYPDFVDQDNKLLGLSNVVYTEKSKNVGNYRTNTKLRTKGQDENSVLESKISKIKLHLKSRSTSSSSEISYIKTPKVMAEAKRHFGCDNLKGVPLEYNGGSGTILAHWSKRYMNNDYMIGDSYGENLISSITLALFEDSGWYKADLTLANLFNWGKGTGCSFFEENCVSPSTPNSRDAQNENLSEAQKQIQAKISIKTSFKNEFCTDTSAPVCSTHNIFRGLCAIKKYDYQLSSAEIHFKDTKIGGVDRLADRCPIPIETKRQQNFYGGSCREGVKGYTFDTIGANSACFITSIKPLKQSRFMQKSKSDDEELVEDTFAKKNMYSKNGKVAGCFEFKCKGNDLAVLFEGKEYLCNNGVVKNIENYSGEIVCPSNEVLCDSKYKCKFGCTERFGEN